MTTKLVVEVANGGPQTQHVTMELLKISSLSKS